MEPYNENVLTNSLFSMKDICEEFCRFMSQIITTPFVHIYRSIVTHPYREKLIRRPMVAWTSYIARRWPLEWYWHPQVLPAYSETTFAWAVFFAVRLYVQYSVFQSENVTLVAVTNFITGWPFTIALLVLTYLYGTWRLVKLQGPSVEEFRAGVPAPWQSQRRGF